MITVITIILLPPNSPDVGRLSDNLKRLTTLVLCFTFFFTFDSFYIHIHFDHRLCTKTNQGQKMATAINVGFLILFCALAYMSNLIKPKKVKKLYLNILSIRIVTLSSISFWKKEEEQKKGSLPLFCRCFVLTSDC